MHVLILAVALATTACSCSPWEIDVELAEPAAWHADELAHATAWVEATMNVEIAHLVDVHWFDKGCVWIDGVCQDGGARGFKRWPSGRLETCVIYLRTTCPDGLRHELVHCAIYAITGETTDPAHAHPVWREYPRMTRGEPWHAREEDL